MRKKKKKKRELVVPQYVRKLYIKMFCIYCYLERVNTKVLTFDIINSF